MVHPQGNLQIGGLLLGMEVLVSFVAVSVGAVFVAYWQEDRVPMTMWAGVSLYGLGLGPVLGFMFDLQNKLKLEESKKLSWIPILYLNLGTTLVPGLTALLYLEDRVSGPTRQLSTLIHQLAWSKLG